MDRRGPGRAAPYGQACMHCFKSKCKCFPRSDGNGCERCHRLNKQCHPADTLRKRNAQESQRSNARIAQLEGKLDGLVSLLQSVTTSPNSSAALRKVLDEELQQQSANADLLTPISPPSSNTVLQATTPIGTHESASPTSTTTSLPTLPSGTLGIDSSSNIYPLPCEPSADEAETYLSLFRSRMLPYCAFIYLPPDLTAQQLRQDRPFLFRAISAVASPSAQQKLARGKELKHVLAQTTILENQSSIDLLLGLLTYVSWGFDQFLNRSATLSRLMMMAISIVYDLRMSKPPPPDARMIEHFSPNFKGHEGNCKGHQGCHGGTIKETDQQVLERQRAVLGCFILSSFVSSYFSQMEAMRWTPQLEECLCTVSASKECPADKGLAFQVRLQLLAQRAVQVREQQQMDQIYQATAAASPVSFLFLKALQGQLQELRASLSTDLPNQASGLLTHGPRLLRLAEILIAHTHYIELCINETAYASNSEDPILLAPAACISVPGFERLECLWRSVTAIKSCLDVLYTMSPSACLGISFHFSVQICRCLVILYRLSTYADPAWDRQAVRNMVDLLQVLDRIVHMLELASSEAGECSNEDVFIQLSWMMRMFRMSAGGKIAPEEAETTVWPYSGNAMGVDNNMMDQNQMMMMQSIDFGNEMWLEEMLAGFR